MKKYKFKKPAKFALLGFGFLLLSISFYLVEDKLFSNDLKKIENDTYVSKTIFDNSVPVIKIDNKEKMQRPYLEKDINVLKTFYNSSDESKIQENSLLYYEGTYLQNSGVIYGTGVFDVVAVLTGEVINITESESLGKTVEIRHDNGVISVYQSLGQVSAAVNDKVSGGEVIGQSGLSNIPSNMGEHLHFELIIDGVNVDPELYYDKTIEEFEA